MRLILCLLLVFLATGLKVEINNIHFGYRNIYQGRASLQGTKLQLTQYTTDKAELTAQDMQFATLTDHQLTLDLGEFVRQFYLEDVDPASPLSLTYNYVHRPSLVLTLSSEETAESMDLLGIADLGLDISEMDL